MFYNGILDNECGTAGGGLEAGKHNREVFGVYSITQVKYSRVGELRRDIQDI